jgi:galactokinase
MCSITKKRVFAQAPGRINIIGEHTDYNKGFVFPAAIDRRVQVEMRRNHSSRQVNILELEKGTSFSFQLQNYGQEGKGWHNYIMGVVYELQLLGADIRGFDAEFSGNVPIGAGMSSSAALECSFAVALNDLFDLKLDQWQLIHACQSAEHRFVGTKCGIMDQFASMMGKENQAMLMDCQSLDFEYIPLELKGYQLLLLNTNVSHSLASSEYNTRRAECEEGVHLLKKEYPAILSLRDVKPEQLELTQEKLPEKIYRRCRHVVLENKRVIDAVKAMRSGSLHQLGELMYASHFSLQNDYEVSCPELDFLVQYARRKEYVLGSRMMGGGFGGCTINLLRQQDTEAFIHSVSKAYEQRYRLALTPVTVAIGDGAKSFM